MSLLSESGHADLTSERLFFVVNRPNVLVQESLGRRSVLALVAAMRPLLKIEKTCIETMKSLPLSFKR